MYLSFLVARRKPVPFIDLSFNKIISKVRSSDLCGRKVKISWGHLQNIFES